MLKAVHAQDDRAAARQKAEQVAAKPKEMKLADAAALVVAGIEETLYYCAFPREHWRCLRTSNPLERLLREVRRNVFERVPNVAPALVTMPNVVSPPSGECGEGSQGIHDSRRGR
jgi:transposase-like protein